MLFISSLILSLWEARLLYQKDKKQHDTDQAVKQLIFEKEALKSEYDRLKNDLNVEGISSGSDNFSSRSVDDFIRDWDTSDFYIVNGDSFCPKNKGKNNFQRMFYTYDTPLTSSDLNLKFRMVDQHNETTDYVQRMVVGMKLDGVVFSEYDVPTRDSQIINFRVTSESGGLVPGGEGKSISSPIKDKSIINLKFQTKPKHGQEITQIIMLDYLSTIGEYGEESKSISYDTKVNDPRPETARTNLFIGSYIWGCIEIIDWQAN